MTAKYQKIAIALAIFSILLNFGPLIGYTVFALCSGAAIVQKFALCGTLLVVGIMTLYNVITHTVMRSRLWILLLGLYLCLESILCPLLIVAVCQVADELIISPLHASAVEKRNIHRELDKRLPAID